MKIIGDLLRIKTHRERQAEAALLEASRALRVAESAVQRAEENLNRVHAEHDAQKRALYDDLFSRLVQRTDLDLTRSKLEKIDASIKECERDLSAKRERFVVAQGNRQEKKNLFRNASRAREKYTELAFQIEAGIVQMQRKKEDLELDEIIFKTSAVQANELATNFESAI